MSAFQSSHNAVLELLAKKQAILARSERIMRLLEQQARQQTLNTVIPLVLDSYSSTIPQRKNVSINTAPGIFEPLSTNLSKSTDQTHPQLHVSKTQPSRHHSQKDIVISALYDSGIPAVTLSKAIPVKATIRLYQQDRLLSYYRSEAQVHKESLKALRQRIIDLTTQLKQLEKSYQLKQAQVNTIRDEQHELVDGLREALLNQANILEELQKENTLLKQQQHQHQQPSDDEEKSSWAHERDGYVSQIQKLKQEVELLRKEREIRPIPYG